MKTIAVFGGSGRTGIPFLKHSLPEFKIKALVRNPEKIGLKDNNLELIQGDITNTEDIRRTIEGSDAVVSLIGHVKGSEEGFQTKAIGEIVELMRKSGIQRIISLTGGGVRNDEDKPKPIDRFIVFAMKNLTGKTSRNALMDGINHTKVITDTDLDWTIVRGPMLTEEPAKRKIEVGNVGTVPGIKLTREDLAIFILDVLKNNTYIKEMPFITNGK